MRPRYIPQCKEVAKRWKVRTPLVVISSCASFIRSIMRAEKIDDHGDSQADSMAKLTKSMAHILVMIEALREHYHISEGLVDYEIEQFLANSYPITLKGDITAKNVTATHIREEPNGIRIDEA